MNCTRRYQFPTRIFQEENVKVCYQITLHYPQLVLESSNQVKHINSFYQSQEKKYFENKTQISAYYRYYK